MSSDKISTVQEPVLSLDMEVQTTDGHKNVSVELNKSQLDNLISSLDAANKVRLSYKNVFLNSCCHFGNKVCVEINYLRNSNCGILYYRISQALKFQMSKKTNYV